MENKPQSIAEAVISDLLASKTIREKEIINENVVGCQSCYFNAVCKTTKDLPCMGRNRADRKGIYYQGIK